MLLNENIALLLDHQIFAVIKEFSIQDLFYLNEKELEIWNEKKLFRNSRDWAMGRLTAKFSIAECLNINTAEIKSIYIENSSNGAPYFINKVEKQLVFSISHCNGIGFSCSSTSFTSIGCDIEKIRKRHPNFPSYYLNTFEEQLWMKKLDSEDRDTILTIAWSCKEACFKCLNSLEGSSETIKDIIIYPLFNNPYNFGFSYRTKKGLGYWFKNNNFAISVAVLL